MNLSRTRQILVVLVACALTAVVTVFVTRAAGPPGDDSPEAGFARDMAVHHAQAAEMGFSLRDNSDDQPIRNLAYDIITTQTAQRGMFGGWLQQWGLNQASDRPPMAWMAGHGGHGAAASPSPGGVPRMPGMASDEEMERLKATKGKDGEILFLQLMIRHHEGGVDMAKALLKLSNRPEVRTMAQHIVDTQDSEIQLMTEMLTARGAKPYPSILTE
ncbi:DUF305 domain-containing protein [Sphaerisporangium rubeum]|uniref:Uncharacterized protein (DUF305 family) n=1 Tax=Sphaerisporangium rubeum TaxID=321317 RepID=A0A7X0IGK5_9ACTN|nr:DUF305 domain-containing protein [Sphaerisporangium rubeum]MBB6474757.1 uncharacterized protein (DUF305 family) [Sphaerisporangium rubeum]